MADRASSVSTATSPTLRWSKLPFFEERPLGSPSLLRAGLVAVCATPDGGVALADDSGVVHLLDRALSEWCSFGAHTRGVSHLLAPAEDVPPPPPPPSVAANAAADAPPPDVLLLTFGRESDSSGSSSGAWAYMRVWAPQAGTSTAECLGHTRIFGGSGAEPAVTAVAAAEGGRLVAVGASDGSVSLLRCADPRTERGLRFRALQCMPPPQLAGARDLLPELLPGTIAEPLRPAAQSAVSLTGLHFGSPPADSDDFFARQLFAVTPLAVVGIRLGGGGGESCDVLSDAGGAPAGCSCVSLDGTGRRAELAVGRPEAVFFYSAEDASRAFAFEGPKIALGWQQTSLVVCTRAAVAVAGRGGGAADGSAVHVYDLRHRCIAHTASLPCDVRACVCGPHRILLLLSDGSALGLEERPLAAKLDALFRSNLYGVALSLAEAQALQPSALGEVRLRYAQHLHSRGELPAAAEQYAATVGVVEPSRVVRLLLAPQDAPLLLSHLQALLAHTCSRQPHAGGAAAADGAKEHAALLLATALQLRDAAAVDAFVDAACGQGVRVAPDVDVDAAIDACRCAGFPRAALRLARHFGPVEEAISVLLDDLMDAPAALSLLAELPPPRAGRALAVHGRSLLREWPRPTLDLLLTRLVAPSARNKLPPPLAEPGGGFPVLGFMGGDEGQLGLEEVVGLFDTRPGWLTLLLERIHAAETPQDARTPGRGWETLLRLYLEPDDAASPHGRSSSEPPSPRTPPARTPPSSPARGGDAPPLARAERHARAIALLQRAPLGSEELRRARLVCAAHGFDAGLGLLYAAQEQPSALLRHQAETRQYDALIATCTARGATQPHLWLDALRHVASLDDGEGGVPPAARQRIIAEVVAAAEREGLLPPLALVEALSAHEGTPLSLVVPLLRASLARDEALVSEAHAEAARFATDAARFEAEATALANTPRVFQRSICSKCSAPVEPPSVHFLCGHSFHANCLADGTAAQDAEPECPTCAPQRRRVREHAAMVASRAVAHDDFYRQLDEAADGFGVVADFFSKGVLSPLGR